MECMERETQIPTATLEQSLTYTGQFAHFLASRAFFCLQGGSPPQAQEEPPQVLTADRDRTFVGTRLFILA